MRRWTNKIAGELEVLVDIIFSGKWKVPTRQCQALAGWESAYILFLCFKYCFLVIPAEAGIHTNPKTMAYYTYILASGRHGTLYIGVTNNIVKRIWEHKQDIVEGFTKKYSVHSLVYFEITESIESAIKREKQLKEWHRQWKINLIETHNPEWKDLYDTILE